MINLDLSKAILWAGGVLGLLAAVVAGWLYLSGLRSDVARLTTERDHLLTQRDEAVRTAQANADATDAIRQESERQMAAVADALAAERQRADRYAKIKETIRHVPAPAQTCPVDPTVLAALDGLRQRTQPAGAADPGPGGEGDRPGAPADLRPGTASARRPNQP